MKLKLRLQPALCFHPCLLSMSVGLSVCLRVRDKIQDLLGYSQQRMRN